jgi:hypothetical protein
LKSFFMAGAPFALSIALIYMGFFNFGMHYGVPSMKGGTGILFMTVFTVAWAGFSAMLGLRRCIKGRQELNQIQEVTTISRMLKELYRISAGVQLILGPLAAICALVGGLLWGNDLGPAMCQFCYDIPIP